MPDQMNWARNYTFPSWDYLASRDFAELSEELNAEFRAGLGNRKLGRASGRESV